MSAPISSMPTTAMIAPNVSADATAATDSAM
jgi:hypothetical protein